MSDADLRGTIPESLYDLTLLTYLDLWGNLFAGASISTRIGRLSRLTYLDLDVNPGISGTLPTQLGLLTALQEQVWLDECSFTGVSVV